MQNKVKNIWLVSRHYIGDEATLNEYREGAKYILAAQKLIDQKKLPINLGTKVTAAQTKTTIENKPVLTAEMKEEIYKINGQIASANAFVLYDPIDRGSGLSFSQMTINGTYLATPSPTIFMGYGMQQFKIDSEEALDNITAFGNQMVINDSLWSSGSRNVEVKLAADPRNSALREIQEMYHSLLIGPQILRVPSPTPPEVQASYREIGESTSDFWAMNISHPQFRLLSSSIISFGDLLNGFFAAEYYTAIKAPLFCPKESPRYVYTYPNKYYSKDVKKEFERIEKHIKDSERRLGKTDIGDMLRATVREEKNVDIISKYYDKDVVELVQGWMLEALTT